MKYILGIDEVGRGALAGPVHLGGVLLPGNYPLLTKHFNIETYTDFSDFTFVRDSKKLKSKDREKAAALIKNYNIQSLVVSASNDLIDTYGIGVCLSHLVVILINVLASIRNCEYQVIIDGKIKLLDHLNSGLVNKLAFENSLPDNYLPDTSMFLDDVFKDNKSKINVIRENKADDKYLSIALASNLAKVQRDDFMTLIGKTYPEFKWEVNKGYGTMLHRQAILRDLNNQYLRKSFLSNILSGI